MRPRRRTKGDVEHETLNPEVEAVDGGAVAPPDPDRLVGNPPIDTLSASGEGSAVAGAGAGGRTPDVRDPLRAPPNDVGSSPTRADLDPFASATSRTGIPSSAGDRTREVPWVIV